MVAVFLYLAIAVASLVYAYITFFYRKIKPGEPPLVPGHWLFGSGKEFAEHAVNFLQGARQKFGDVFTIRLLNQHWTMILDVHSFERFSREKNFDFDLVQKQVNRNVFHYALKDARKMISEAGQKVNGKYLFSYMDNFAQNLGKTMRDAMKADQEQETSTTPSSPSPSVVVSSDKTIINNCINESKSQSHLYDNLHNNSSTSINPADLHIERLLNTETKIPADDNDGWKEDYLREFASETFFSAVFYTIFGRSKPGDVSTFHPTVFHKNFDTFHKYFNYLWLGLPRKLFPAACEAAEVLAKQPTSHEMMDRDGCSDYMKTAIEFMLKKDQTETDIVGHNLVFLHVNYNTFRCVFWCLYKLMSDAKANAAVRKELEEAVDAKRSGDRGDNSVDFTIDEINKLPVLDSFLKEIFRWSSGVFMVRYCVGDTQFTTDDGKTYTIRDGDKVAIYPPVIHMDPEIFHDPQEFIYDRFVNAEFYKNGKLVKNPIIGFGSLCPGQKLSVLEIKWFIMNILNNYKMELVEGQVTAPNTHMYGHEILPPTNDVLTRIKEREGACQLNFVNNYKSKSTAQV